MKNNWIGKVLGEEVKPLESKSVKPAISILHQVLGEEEEKPKAKPESEPKEKPESEPPVAAEKESTPATDVDAVAEPGASDHVSDPVQALASLWSSGGKMDVAVKLLTEPVRYTDFIGLVQAIGPESALELGQILDDLVEGEDEGAPPADNVLSRVDGFKKQRSGDGAENGEFQRRSGGDLAAVTQTAEPR